MTDKEMYYVQVLDMQNKRCKIQWLNGTISWLPSSAVHKHMKQRYKDLVNNFGKKPTKFSKVRLKYEKEWIKKTTKTCAKQFYDEIDSAKKPLIKGVAVWCDNCEKWYAEKCLTIKKPDFENDESEFLPCTHREKNMRSTLIDIPENLEDYYSRKFQLLPKEYKDTKHKQKTHSDNDSLPFSLNTLSKLKTFQQFLGTEDIGEDEEMEEAIFHVLDFVKELITGKSAEILERKDDKYEKSAEMYLTYLVTKIFMPEQKNVDYEYQIENVKKTVQKIIIILHPDKWNSIELPKDLEEHLSALNVEFLIVRKMLLGSKGK